MSRPPSRPPMSHNRTWLIDCYPTCIYLAYWRFSYVLIIDGGGTHFFWFANQYYVRLARNTSDPAGGFNPFQPTLPIRCTNWLLVGDQLDARWVAKQNGSDQQLKHRWLFASGDHDPHGSLSSKMVHAAWVLSGGWWWMNGIGSIRMMVDLRCLTVELAWCAHHGRSCRNSARPSRCCSGSGWALPSGGWPTAM